MSSLGRWYGSWLTPERSGMHAGCLVRGPGCVIFPGGQLDRLGLLPGNECVSAYVNGSNAGASQGCSRLTRLAASMIPVRGDGGLMVYDLAGEAARPRKRSNSGMMRSWASSWR